MKQTFTTDLLIKYIYQETSASETIAIREALSESNALMAKYEELLASYQQLPSVKFSPKSSTLQNILKYSRRSALQKQA